MLTLKNNTPVRADQGTKKGGRVTNKKDACNVLAFKQQEHLWRE